MPTKLPDAATLARSLVDQYGISLRASLGEAGTGKFIDLLPSGVHPNEGFCVRLTLGWRTILCNFFPGKWAGSLIQEMGAAPHPKKEAFARLSQALLSAGGEVTLKVNGSRMAVDEPGNWPTKWSELDLSVSSGPIELDAVDTKELEKLAAYWTGGVLGLAALLLPLEEEVQMEPEAEIEPLPEGAKVQIQANRYERSRVNRAICISVRGNSCSACGFEFGKTYGALGANFIHVHHVVPVSRMGPNYVVNPATDLIPLCANCHAMVHRSDPPLSVTELREILGKD